VAKVAGGEAKISVTSRVLSLAWPAIVEQTLAMTVGIADTAMVGRIGAYALASVGLGAQVMMVAITVFAAISTGTTALVARCIGAGEKEEACRVARQSLVLGVSIAVATSAALLIWAPQVVHLLFRRSEPHVLANACIYVRIVGAALIPNFLMIIMNSILRGSGDTKTPMRVMAIVNVINVSLNYLLIFGHGPWPAMGVKGAALATALAQLTGGLLLTRIMFSGRKIIHLHWRDNYRPHMQTIKRVLRVGVPAGIEQAVMRIGQVSYTIIVSSLGTVAYAAHQIALNAESLSFMPGFGFALAATTLVGQALGAGDTEEAGRSGWQAAKLAALIMGAIGVLFFLFPSKFVSIFTPDKDVIANSAQVLRIVAIAQPFLALNMVLAGGLRGAGDTRTIMFITGIGVCGVRLVLAYTLVSLGYGLVGAWVAMVVDLIMRSCFLLWRFHHGGWKHIRV
jgi:putative MATE family efflux protein